MPGGPLISWDFFFRPHDIRDCFKSLSRKELFQVWKVNLNKFMQSEK